MQDLKTEFRISSDQHDPWGSVMAWRFAIADFMTDNGLQVPAEWEFRQGLGGSDKEAYEYETLSELKPSEKDLLAFANLLYRYDLKLRVAGKDY